MILKKALITLNLLLILFIFLYDSSASLNNPFIVDETGDINVYFCPEDACSSVILQEINVSKKIFCAFYDLDDKQIISLLKKKKGEILIHHSNFNGFGHTVESKGLMHNKFCILDDKKILTGSFNPTEQNLNRNNLLVIESPHLAKNYKDEWIELKNKKKTNTKYKKIHFNNYTLKNYFCPEDDCEEKIMTELLNAKKSIHFLTFTFTDKRIAEILIQKKKEGVEISGMIEKFQNPKYSVYYILLKEGINVTLYSSEELQHNKVFIIDEKTIVTGSYNPTKSAATINDENILILEQPSVAEKYNKYFESFVI